MTWRSILEAGGPLEPLARAVRGLLEEPIPQGVGWSRVFGSVLVFLLMVQLTTGILLSVYYSPSTETAWESARFIETDVLFGRLVRGLHHWAASAFIVVLVLHLGQVFVSGGFKTPRQGTWTLGVVLLLIGLGFGYTGYLLPWDLRAYFGTKVGTEIPGAVPLVGRAVLRLLRGGDEVGPLTLTRFYAVHAVALPVLTILLVALHLFLVRRHGIAPARTRVGETVRYAGRFFPDQFVRDGFAIVLTAAIVFALARLGAPPLEARADPQVTAYVPSPDWYFLGLQQLQRIFTGSAQILGTFVLPSLAVLLLFLVPVLDRSAERSISRRPFAALCGAIAAVSVIGLTAAGAVAVQREREALERRTAAVGHATSDDPLEVSSPIVVLGMSAFVSMKCQSCHVTGSQGMDNVPALGIEGSRVRREWLYDYLRNPYPIRWDAPTGRPVVRMPDFRMTETEIAATAEYLLTLTNDDVVPREALPPLERDSAAAARGARLFHGAKCDGCHRIGDDGEDVGPELTRAGRRLRPAFMAAMIRAPQSVVPGTVMQVPALDDRKIADLVAYLETLR